LRGAAAAASTGGGRGRLAGVGDFGCHACGRANIMPLSDGRSIDGETTSAKDRVEI
jgi:hypothetical protein